MGGDMSIAIDLLKSEHIGIRELKEHLSEVLKRGKSLIITDRGAPVNVLLPYSDMLELADIIEEISDPETLENIREGRVAVMAGAKGIPVSRLFKKIKSKVK